MTSKSAFFRSVAIVAPMLGLSGLAIAQNAPAPTSAAAEGGLQEIVVTAQKRAENLQKVPIAITAVSGAALATQGIKNTQQLGTVAPGLTIRTTAGAFQPYIRGIGTSSNVVENPVALYIDGVYLPQQREGLRDLSDISQVAVLKGPQGTLFGRNATGGVIQITTAAPSHTFGGNAHAEIDQYGTARLNAYMTGGLTDTVAASLSGSFATQANGWGKDYTNGHDTFKIRHDASIRGKILWEPSSSTSVTLIADYMNNDELTNSRQPYDGLPLAFPGTGPLKNVYDSYGGKDSFNKFVGGGISLTINQDLSFAKLVSITSYRQGKATFQFDNSSVPQPFFVNYSPNSPNKDYTQEIQLISPQRGAFHWVAGVFYYHNDFGTDPYFRNFGGIFTLTPTSAKMTTTRSNEVTESVAPFGEVNWEFLPKTHLTLGARFTYERRTLDDASVVAQLVNGRTVTTNYNYPALTVKKPTFRAVIDHNFSDGVLAYASFNTGIKSGGFNNINPANPGYLPEKLQAYEVGLKTQLFDKRLRLNLAGFYYDYTNIQVIQFVGLAQAVVNGPKAQLYGLDADFQAKLATGLTASGGFEALHAEFTNYPAAISSIPKPLISTTPYVGGGATLITVNASGNRLPTAQKFTATLALDYHKAIERGAFDFNVTGNYNGSYYFEADNFLRQPAYVMLNSSLKYTFPDNRTSVSVWGRNLFDEKIITQAPTQGLGYTATYASPPRTYGMSVDVKF